MGKAHFLSGMLIFGTLTALTMKMQLKTEIVFGGRTHTFDKPFFQTLAMFFAMAFCLLGSFLTKKKAQNDLEKVPLILNPEKETKKTSSWVVMIPCIYDLVASTLMTYGLIPITLSIFQMLRGSMVIYSSFLSWIFLKKRLNVHNICGVALCTFALILVGWAGVHIPDSGGGGKQYTKSAMIIGCTLVLVSQFVQAGQVVTEEFLLKNLDLPAFKVVGFEGLFGFFLTALIACPIAYFVPGSDISSRPHNSLENTIDSFECLYHSLKLSIIVFSFMVAVLAYNFYGMSVTNSFTAIHRTIFEAIRTACIWVVDIILFYTTKQKYGEKWDNTWSYVELAGFVLLILSSFVYDGLLFPKKKKYNTIQ